MSTTRTFGRRPAARNASSLDAGRCDRLGVDEVGLARRRHGRRRARDRIELHGGLPQLGAISQANRSERPERRETDPAYGSCPVGQWAVEHRGGGVVVGRSPRRRGSVVVALVLASVGLAACGVATSTIPRTLVFPGPVSAPATVQLRVRVASPRAQVSAVIPKGRYLGVIRGAFVDCGAAGASLSPAQMAGHPVDVTLWYRHHVVERERLTHRSGFVFVVVGSHRPPITPVPGLRATPRVLVSMAGHSPWSPELVLTTSSGLRQAVDFGGLDGLVGVSLQIPPAACTR